MAARFKADYRNVHVEGLVGLHDDAVFLDFEPVGAFRDGSIVEKSIPVSMIDDVSFRYGLIGAKLRIRALEMRCLCGIPWRRGPDMELAVSEREARKARALANEILAVIRRIPDDA
ncbi:MAG: hypothetical protein P8Y95_15210 [Gammaproteobacteria bacterium]|jgi:hypothetical protein